MCAGLVNPGQPNEDHVTKEAQSVKQMTKGFDGRDVPPGFCSLVYFLGFRNESAAAECWLLKHGNYNRSDLSSLHLSHKLVE